MTLTAATDYTRITELLGAVPERVGAYAERYALDWVLQTADSALEAFTYAAENNEYLDDVAHEVADAATPVFTHSVWTIYYQLGAWDRQLTDYEDALLTDPTHNARVALYDIALEIAMKVLADFEKQREDGDDMIDPLAVIIRENLDDVSLSPEAVTRLAADIRAYYAKRTASVFTGGW